MQTSEHCCDVPKSGDTSICKECSKNGRPVKKITLKNLVKSQKLGAIKNLDGFQFCETLTCKIVYFNNEQQIYLHKKDVKVRVGIKETEDPIRVCYCFGWTREKIFDQIKQQGYSTAAQEISAKMKAGECGCETNNPSGSCCLSEVNKVIREGTELYSKAITEEQKVRRANERVSIYEVPLVCPAAPNIGCGSKSKPILLDLENQSTTVAEAWLDRTGTHVAIVWIENTLPTSRSAKVESVFKKYNLNAEEIGDKEYTQLLQDFSSGKDWYRGTNVDRLTEEEAIIIADRLVRRIKNKVSISDTGANALESAFANFFKKRFIEDSAKPRINSKTKIEEELLVVGRKCIDKKDEVILQEIISLGYRPLPDEN